MVLTGVTNETFSASLVGRFYLNGSMKKLSGQQRKIGKKMQNRKQKAQEYAQEQLNILSEREMMKLLNKVKRLERELEKRRNEIRIESAARVIQTIAHRFIFNRRRYKCQIIQKWWKNNRIKVTDQAARLLRYAILLRCFFSKWRVSVFLALRIQRWFRFRAWYRNELSIKKEKVMIEELCAAKTRSIVSFSLSQATEICLRRVSIEHDSAMIIQRFWRRYTQQNLERARNEECGAKSNASKFPSRVQMLHLRREAKFEREKKLRLEKVAEEKRRKLKIEEECQRVQEERKTRKENEKRKFAQNYKARVLAASKRNSDKRHQEEKSAHFRFSLDNRRRSSKHAKAILKARQVETVRNLWQSMAKALRLCHNRKYTAVLGLIRARLRVRRRQALLEMQPQRPQTTKNGSGIKFLLSRAF
jgi:hypothetical protein